MAIFLPGADAEETLKSLMLESRLPKLAEIKIKLKPKNSDEPVEETITFTGLIDNFNASNSTSYEKDAEDQLNRMSLPLAKTKAEQRNRIVLYKESEI